MKRRTFVKSSLVSTAGIFAGGLIFSSCKKDKLPYTSWNGRIIIIGAGISGIYAAHLLQKQGIKNITILEASNRWGGRIKADKTFADFAIELGAEEVHGNKSRWYSIVNDASGNLIETGGLDYIQLDGVLKKLDSVSADNDIVKANQIIDTASYYSGPEINVAAYALQQNLAERVNHLVEAQLGNEYGTSNSRLSLPGIATADQLWNAGNKNYSLTNKSYSDIIQQQFAEALNLIQYNKNVKAINYESSEISISTEDGAVFNADKIIITVPISILSSSHISFTPALPSSKIQAINNIGMDAGMKVILKFNNRFWDANLGSLFAPGAAPEYWATGLDKTADNKILTAFVMGEKAETLSMAGNNAVDMILQQLNNVYGGNTASAAFADAIVADWSKEPFIKGAYSYPKIASNSVRTELAKTVNSKLYFAGEAANVNGSFATVHGAVDAAYACVKELLESLQ
jgi:monoamine oxidase